MEIDEKDGKENLVMVNLIDVFPTKEMDIQVGRIINEYIDKIKDDDMTDVLMKYEYNNLKSETVLYKKYDILSFINEELKKDYILQRILGDQRHVKLFQPTGWDMMCNTTEAEFTVRFYAFKQELNVTIDKINAIYENNGYVYKYFSFINSNSAYYQLFNGNVDLDPDLYEIGATITEELSDKIMESFKDTFYDHWPGSSPYKLISEYSDKGDIYNIFNMLGWRKQKIFDILLINGVFDYTVEKYGKYYCYKMTTLSKFWVVRPPPTKSLPITGINGITYPPHLKNMPKFVLEAIYRKIFTKNVNWDKICKTNLVDVGSIKSAAKRMYNVQFNQDDDDKQIVCGRIKSIQRNIELSPDISELSQQFISQPGGTQYLKYADQPKMFFRTEEEYIDRTQADISTYSLDINNICRDHTKTNINAYNMAVRYGLSNYVTEYMTKEQICEIMNNYLRLVREGRSL